MNWRTCGSAISQGAVYLYGYGHGRHSLTCFRTSMPQPSKSHTIPPIEDDQDFSKFIEPRSVDSTDSKKSQTSQPSFGNSRILQRTPRQNTHQKSPIAGQKYKSP